MTEFVSAIVLAGGTSRRFGSDKLAARLGDWSVLDHCLLGMPSAWPVVVVGPSRVVAAQMAGRVRFVRESPPGGGPLAGVAAGLAAVSTELVCVVPGDTPRAGAVVPLLVAALEADPSLAGAVLGDGSGQENPILAAYRTARLREALPLAPAGVAARSLLSLPHVVVRAAVDVRDIDTPEDLERGLDRDVERHLERRHERPG